MARPSPSVSNCGLVIVQVQDNSSPRTTGQFVEENRTFYHHEPQSLTNWSNITLDNRIFLSDSTNMSVTQSPVIGKNFVTLDGVFLEMSLASVENFYEKSNLTKKKTNIFTSFSPKNFLTIFLVKSKLSTAKKSKTTTFSRVFHPKKNRKFSRKIKVEFSDKK